MGDFKGPPDFVADIQRLAARVAQLEQNRPVPVVSGAPTDSPPDGHMRIDKTAARLYVRVNGVWKYAALT